MESITFLDTGYESILSISECILYTSLDFGKFRQERVIMLIMELSLLPDIWFTLIMS